MSSASKQHMDAGMLATRRAEYPEAAKRLQAAARGFLAAKHRDNAMAALVNLSFARKACGELPAALAAADEAIALFTPKTPDEDRAPALLARATALDRLADPAAAEAWRTAASAVSDQPLLAATCLAHAAGTLMQTDRLEALRQARAASEPITFQTPTPLVVGFLGAFGESAPGATGLPFLAHAVLLMFGRAGSFSAANAQLLELLAERLGYDHPMAEIMCMIGVGLIKELEDTPDYRPAVFHLSRVVQRSAAARSISTEAMFADYEPRWAKGTIELLTPLRELAITDWIFTNAPPLS